MSFHDMMHSSAICVGIVCASVVLMLLFVLRERRVTMTAIQSESGPVPYTAQEHRTVADPMTMKCSGCDLYTFLDECQKTAADPLFM